MDHETRRSPGAGLLARASSGALVAALAGLLVLGQSLGLRALLGIACVIVASIGVSRSAAQVPLAV